MAKPSKTLQLMALKLGLDEEDKVLSKAAEFERLLQTKFVNNITDTAKTVICLDLAASYLKVGVDLKSAVKCSGLKTPTYNNSRKIIENVLELNGDKLSISTLCLMLQCQVQDLAERILEKYRTNAKMDLDMNLPQYVCMAVYQACRISKTKVPKSKLVDKSQLKPAQWTKLDTEWTKFTDENFAVMKKKKGRPAKSGVTDEEKMDIEEDIDTKKEVQTTEPQVEPYEEWKRRVLGAAYREVEKQTNKEPYVLLNKKPCVLLNKDLNKKKYNEKEVELNEKENYESQKKQLKITFSPRKSPRKTPQKYEPYTSPVKSKGVRLLFPL